MKSKALTIRLEWMTCSIKTEIKFSNMVLHWHQLSWLMASPTEMILMENLSSDRFVKHLNLVKLLRFATKIMTWLRSLVSWVISKKSMGPRSTLLSLSYWGYSSAIYWQSCILLKDNKKTIKNYRMKSSSMLISTSNSNKMRAKKCESQIRKSQMN